MIKYSKLDNCGQVKELYKCKCEACISMTKILELTNKLLEMDSVADECVIEELRNPVVKVNNFLKGE